MVRKIEMILMKMGLTTMMRMMMACMGIGPTTMAKRTGRYPAAHGRAVGIDPTGWAVTSTMEVMVKVCGQLW